MTYYHWLGAQADEIACEYETAQQVILEAIPVVDHTELPDE